MAHELAKLLLKHAETIMGRKEAVEKAISLGMPLNEIESYLDWLDQMREIMRKIKMIDSKSILLLFAIVAVGGLWFDAGPIYWIGWYGLAIFTILMLKYTRLVKSVSCGRSISP